MVLDFTLSLVYLSLVNAVLPTLVLTPFVLFSVSYYRKMQKKDKKMTWVKGVSKTLFPITLVIVALLFLGPQLLYPQDLNQPEDEIFIEVDLGTQVANVLLQLVLTVVKTVMFSAFAIPFIFIGDYVYNKTRERWPSKKSRTGLVVLATYVVMVVFVALTYLWPWLYPTLTFLLFYLEGI